MQSPHYDRLTNLLAIHKMWTDRYKDHIIQDIEHITVLKDQSLHSADSLLWDNELRNRRTGNEESYENDLLKKFHTERQTQTDKY